MTAALKSALRNNGRKGQENHANLDNEYSGLAIGNPTP